jgi:DNA repair exonuclease SbcCD ATPase subunit
MKQIVVKNVTIKNFLSVGEDPVRIDFTKGFHIITGTNRDKEDRRNGVGKSTIADSINFAFFGSTLRELKKELIPNNITNSRCQVDLQFDVITSGGVTEYYISRSLSPSSFTIFKNGVDITRDSIINSTVYIEDIINCTEEVFQNCVIMTINNTIPFMAKKKVEKRKFIEGIFNLEIFSNMILNLRSDANETKKLFDVESTKYDEANTSLINYSKQNDNIIKDRKDKLGIYTQRLKNNKGEYDKLKLTIVDISDDLIKSNNFIIDSLEDKSSQLSLKRDEILNKISILTTKNSTLLSNKNKIGTDADICPVCLHDIGQHDREHIKDEKLKIQSNIDDNIITIDKLKDAVYKIDSGCVKIRDTIKTIQYKNQQTIQKINDQKIIKQKILQLEEFQIQLKQDIKELIGQNNGLDAIIKEYENKLTDIKVNINNIKNKLNMLDVVKYVVSEEGVKSYIVKKMLTLFNSRLSYYLKKMDSNCVCIFNEYFEEQIINEKGKICSYFNFSGAERKNIDLACLFAFMDIRKLQGNVSFNFSMYDELFDSSLDNRGVELVVNILKDRIETHSECVMVISHRKESIKATQGNVIFLEKHNGITRKVDYNVNV